MEIEKVKRNFVLLKSDDGIVVCKVFTGNEVGKLFAKSIRWFKVKYGKPITQEEIIVFKNSRDYRWLDEQFEEDYIALVPVLVYRGKVYKGADGKNTGDEND